MIDKTHRADLTRGSPSMELATAERKYCKFHRRGWSLVSWSCSMSPGSF